MVFLNSVQEDNIIYYSDCTIQEHENFLY